MRLKIIYEDNHLLVLDKPAGMLTQPSGRDEESLESLAKAYLKESKPGNVFLEAIHRLDRAASGLVIFAKTSKALSRLMEAVRKGEMEKIYLAWVEGRLSSKEGVLEDHLIHTHHKAEVVTAFPGAKLARLKYEEVERKGDRTLYKIHLETGRYHQIRVQFASRGCPVVGDIKYGAPPSFRPGILLHHHRCAVPHPTKRTPLTLTSDPDYYAWHA